jgi:hypothetical protein
MLDVALKEWAVVCDLLLTGRLTILLRKGGIHEAKGPGVFELEHPRFALYRTWAHQRPEMLKPEFQAHVATRSEPATITLDGIGEAVRIWRVPSRAAFDRLDDLHCWSVQQIDMRFDYKPDRPLYLMAVRARRLASPRTIANHAEYAGCRSWVPLRPGDGVDETGASPALDDAHFAALIDRVDDAMR